MVTSQPAMTLLQSLHRHLEGNLHITCFETLQVHLHVHCIYMYMYLHVHACMARSRAVMITFPTCIIYTCTSMYWGVAGTSHCVCLCYDECAGLMSVWD